MIDSTFKLLDSESDDAEVLTCETVSLSETSSSDFDASDITAVCEGNDFDWDPDDDLSGSSTCDTEEWSDKETFEAITELRGVSESSKQEHAIENFTDSTRGFDEYHSNEKTEQPDSTALYEGQLLNILEEKVSSSDVEESTEETIPRIELPIVTESCN